MKGVGLALGGGFAKGYAHLGVIKVLEENKIPINYIAGTSMGSFVGAMYCSGLSVKEIRKIFYKTRFDKLVDFELLQKGLIKGKKLDEKLHEIFKNKKFENLKIPFASVAVNITDKKETTFRKGDVAEAVHASVSFPGMFDPAMIKNKKYIDGGMTSPVPVKAVRGLGADRIIAVDLQGVEGAKLKNDPLLEKMKNVFLIEELDNIRSFATKKVKNAFILSAIIKGLTSPRLVKKLLKRKKHKFHVPDIFETLSSSLGVIGHELNVTKLAYEKPDIILRPKINKNYRLAFDQIDYFIKKGEEEARRNIKKIKTISK